MSVQTMSALARVLAKAPSRRITAMPTAASSSIKRSFFSVPHAHHAVAAQALDVVQFLPVLLDVRDDMHLAGGLRQIGADASERIRRHDVNLQILGQHVQHSHDTRHDLSVHGHRAVVVQNQMLQSEASPAGYVDSDHAITKVQFFFRPP